MTLVQGWAHLCNTCVELGVEAEREDTNEEGPESESVHSSEDEEEVTAKASSSTPSFEQDARENSATPEQLGWPGAVVEETCVTSPSSGSQPWTDLKAQAYFIAEKERIWSSKQMDTFQKIHELQQSLNRVAHFLPPALLKVMVNVITDIKADAQQEQNKHSD